MALVVFVAAGAVFALLVAWILWKQALDRSELEARLLHLEMRLDQHEGRVYQPGELVPFDRRHGFRQ